LGHLGGDQCRPDSSVCIPGRALSILFDQGVPKPLQAHLSLHEVIRAYQLGWARKKNGELLALAESAGFEMLITTDQRLRYQ
jgi:hypothetical protein